jgi:hypothetical protein
LKSCCWLQGSEIEAARIDVQARRLGATANAVKRSGFLCSGAFDPRCLKAMRTKAAEKWNIPAPDQHKRKRDELNKLSSPGTPA